MTGILITRPLRKNELAQLMVLRKDAHRIYATKEAGDLGSELDVHLLELNDQSQKHVEDFVETGILNYYNDEQNNAQITLKLKGWTLHPFHFHRFRLYYYLLKVYRLRALINMLDEDTVEVYNDTDDFTPFIEIEKKVKYHSRPVAQHKTSNRSYAKYFLSRGLTGLFSGFKNAQHLILNDAGHEQLVLQKDNTVRIDNPFVGYLFDQLDNDFVILDEIPYPLPDAIPESRCKSYQFKERSVVYSESIVLKGLLNPGILMAFFSLSSDLKKAYKTMANDGFYKLINFKLAQLHSSSRLYLLRYLCYKRLFNKGKIKSFSAIGENNSMVKAIMEAGKAAGVKTVGIQHGTIHSKNFNYRFSQHDMKHAPVPELNLVWGEYWKEELIRTGNYKAESIIVTGQVRTDIIESIGSESVKNDFTVVYASQPFMEMDKRRTAATEVFKALSKIPDVILMVKPHPNERDDGFFHELAKASNCTNYSINRSDDLYVILSNCQALLTCYSTVGAEAIYFDKPVLTLDPHSEDLQGYAQEGVAFQCKDASDIVEYLEKIRDGKAEDLSAQRKEFIHKYAFQIDGMSAKRVMENIKA